MAPLSSSRARNPTSATITRVRFWTSDVATDVQEMKERGVLAGGVTRFPALQDCRGTSRGIGKSAWFKDPDGNTIARSEPE